MHQFKVWAPRPKKVALKIDEETVPMQGPDERGWWRAAVEDAGHGTDYGFILDDDAIPYPDPRSEWQPNGVHGLSRLYDHTLFEWHDARSQAPPLASAVLYELHVGTFTQEGTFDAAIGQLDYLYDLGITHVEAMPVGAYAGDRGWGYDGVGLFAVTENYGGPDGLKRFVDACHVRGIAVVLDVVYNHFGPVGNYTGRFGPYVTSQHCTPWGDAVNFEARGSDEVRRFFCDNALMWMRDFHIDGLRLDAVHEFVDRSAIHFLEQLASEVEVLGSTLGRRLVLIAESDLNDPRIVRPREAGGYGMDAQWSDDFHHALFTVLHVEPDGKGYYSDFGSFGKLTKALTDVFVYDGEYSKYRNRSHGRPVKGLSGHHFVTFIQNHDQIGNRATGDRLQHILGWEKAKIAAALVLTAPFVPLLFQGEEYAAETPFQYFADHEDPEMAKAVSQGRKKEFAAFGFGEAEVPDPEDRATFERSKLNWAEIDEPEHAAMLAFVKRLIRLRRSSPSLNDGDLGHVTVTSDESKRWLAMRRGAIELLLNLGREEKKFDLREGSWIALASRDNIAIEDDRIVLPPDSIAVVSCEPQ